LPACAITLPKTSNTSNFSHYDGGGGGVK